MWCFNILHLKMQGWVGWDASTIVGGKIARPMSFVPALIGVFSMKCIHRINADPHAMKCSNAVILKDDTISICHEMNRNSPLSAP